MILLQLAQLLLLYIAIAAAIIFLVIKVASWIAVSPRTKWVWCWLSIVFFILLPVWDLPLANWEFKRLCETEAGTRINRSVSGVEGFTSVFFGGSEDLLKEYGYQFVEGTNFSKQWVRYSLDKQGKVIQREIDMPIAKYRIELYQTSLRYANKIEIVVEDSQTKDKLATKTEFGFRGGWISKRFHLSYTPEDSCRGNNMTLKDFITTTLKPATRPL